MRLLSASFLLASILVTSGCGGGGGCTGAPAMQPEQAAQPALVALRDGDFDAATAVLSTGRAAREFGGKEGLHTIVEAFDLKPASWTWGKPEYKTERHGGGDDYHYVEVIGAVKFADGTRGRAIVTMEALGCQANPWRINTFALKRDEAST